MTQQRMGITVCGRKWYDMPIFFSQFPDVVRYIAMWDATAEAERLPLVAWTQSDQDMYRDFLTGRTARLEEMRRGAWYTMDTALTVFAKLAEDVRRCTEQRSLSESLLHDVVPHARAFEVFDTQWRLSVAEGKAFEQWAAWFNKREIREDGPFNGLQADTK